MRKMDFCITVRFLRISRKKTFVINFFSKKLAIFIRKLIINGLLQALLKINSVSLQDQPYI